MKLKLGVLVLLAVAIMLTIFSCSSVNPAARVAKDQREREYPFWLKNQNFGGKKDWRVAVAEKQVKAYELKKKRQAEEEDVLKQVEEIKSKIGND